MNYSNEFKGWIGRIGDTFTYQNAYDIAVSLSHHYKAYSTKGQKLVIGYDTRYFSKEFAFFFASIMAKNGVKTFLSNKPAPSSVLIVSSKHKKSMGTVVLTGDQNKANILGIKAFDSNGYSLPPSLLDTVKQQYKYYDDNEINKWISKGLVEKFDPVITYRKYIQDTFQGENFLPNVKILLNPLYGTAYKFLGGILLSDYDFNGYALDFNELVTDFEGITPSVENNFEQFKQDMEFHGIDVGMIISPDCTTFEFLYNDHGSIIRLSTFQILELISTKFKNSNSKVLLSTELGLIAKQYPGLKNVVFSSTEQFEQDMREGDFAVGIDHLNRFYFKDHGAADALLACYYLINILTNEGFKSNIINTNNTDVIFY